MERKKKFTIAQTIPHVDDVLGGAQKALNNAKSWDDLGRGAIDPNSDDNDPKPERVIDPLNQLNQSDQQARSQFLTQGLDGSVVDANVSSLQALGVKQSDARQFMNDVANIANSSAAGITQVFEVGMALFKRFKNLNMAKNVLEEIGQNAAKIPGINLWAIALKASFGQPVTSDFSEAALALWQADNYNGPLTQYNAVLSDIVSIFDPSSDLGQILNRFNDARNQRRMNEEGTKLDVAQSMAEVMTQAEQEMNDQMEKLNRSLPGLLHSPAYAMIMRLMTGIAKASKAWQARSDIAQLKPASAPQASGWNASAATMAARKVLAQQTAPTNSTTPPNYPNSNIQNEPSNIQQINQNGDAANNGQYNPATNQQLQHGGQMSTQQIELTRCSTFEKTLTKTFQTTWSTLMNMLSGGDQGVGGQNAKTPYITPDQIQATSVQLGDIASQGLDNSTTALNIVRQLQNGVQYQNVAGVYLTPSMIDQVGNNGEAISNQGIIQEWVKIQSEWQMRRLQAMDMGVVGPIVQQMESMMPYVTYYESQIDLANATMNGVGSSQYVMPYVQVCNQIAGLYIQAAQHYVQIAQQGASNPALVQFANRQRERYMMEAAQIRNKGVAAIAKLSGMAGNKAGDVGLMSARANRENPLVRFAEELEKLTTTKEETAEVDNEEGNYYDDLYKGTDVPNYGDALENPAKYRGVPTTEIGRKQPRRKKIRLDI